MDDIIYIMPDEIDVVSNEDYYTDVAKQFSSVPEVAKPLLRNAKAVLSKIEEMLYSAPAFINAVKASIPEETFQAILTDEQKSKFANGALTLMTKKDGSLMANLVNPETKKIVSTVSLKTVKVTPEISQAMTSYATQMQMAQIAEQIELIKVAVEEVRQGQEYDRLATAYSCQQKLLQAMTIKNPELKAIALLRIASDAEDSRNLLMQSQNTNVSFVKNQPESFWGKFISGAAPEKVNSRMNEIRESLYAVNMVSLSEAIAYHEMGETEAAQQSLKYYAEYIQKTYLGTKGLVERLDLIDPSPENYWSKTLPDIEKKIQALPCNIEQKLLGGEYDGDQ
ncbi:hypothetical protein [Parasporobacterium paucivorans]|uniref:Uncharacterized protein n=1 Tax=Parasporobacterium paucivorans DSM 15970 TaxID=1122934 RepID=A0A1M6HWZ2_9FIRM|nr:hypothetical protein [Parasporobacterium paucivorans]SHJ26721.1 hypothetical protein SAMN02745691_01633 [Parasporobacterium paucivorans DSM 15970]